jgi:hypothetical protein
MSASIGQFEFLSLAGQVEPPKEECLLLSRPGVEGVAVWRVGKRGIKFTLRSTVDAESHAHARQLFAAYAATIGGEPVELVWDGLEMTDEGFKVIVLDVRPVEIKAIIGGVGGLNYPSEGWCVCDWDLVAVVPVEEEESGSESEPPP